MWKRRIHVCFHRVVGGSIAMVGLLTQLKEVDLGQFVGADNAGKAVAAIGLLIIALEFLPLLGQLLDSGERKEGGDGHPVDNS